MPPLRRYQITSLNPPNLPSHPEVFPLSSGKPVSPNNTSLYPSLTTFFYKKWQKVNYKSWNLFLDEKIRKVRKDTHFLSERWGLKILHSFLFINTLVLLIREEKRISWPLSFLIKNWKELFSDPPHKRSESWELKTWEVGSKTLFLLFFSPRGEENPLPPLSPI